MWHVSMKRALSLAYSPSYGLGFILTFVLNEFRFCLVPVSEHFNVTLFDHAQSMPTPGTEGENSSLQTRRARAKEEYQ